MERTEIERSFIGWDQPILPSVVSRLLSAYSKAQMWDMRDLLLVLPSGQGKRRLFELLALRAQQEKLILYPPQIVTVGELPEHLYVAKYPFASELVQILAWVYALRHTSPADLQHLVPNPPQANASQQWLELGKILSNLHRELASDRLDFSTVADSLGRTHFEAPRWQALAKIQTLYLQELDRLELWDIQTARLCALKFNEPTTQQKIIVAGCVDLNHTQRAFLQAVAEHIELWIAAPEDMAHRFDAYGCLESQQWLNAQVRVATEQLLVGNSPKDQAELAAACVAEVGDRFHARQVTIGVPDSTLVAELKHHLELCNAHARYGAGRALASSEPVRLLALIGRYIQDRSYTAFAALLRHPAVGNLLRVQKIDLPSNWLSQIDDYYQAALPKTIGTFVNTEVSESAVYQVVCKAINRWLNQLNARTLPISSWVQPLLAVMTTAYDRMECDLDDPVEGPLFQAAKQTCAAIVELRDIPHELEPKMTVPELIEWLLRNMSGSLIPESADATSIEMLGWLELALDDAPALIVVGMHDGVVPESVNSDSFLPNQLRRSLGMMDNNRRYARDLYILQVMLQTRELVRIIVGKSDANGDPLVPSRLLMACDLSELPARVLHLVQEDAADALPTVERSWKPVEGLSRIAIPKPIDVRPPNRITVTAFRDYLKCPYRFYLRHVLRLREEDDSELELDARGFGVLVHDTLTLLGESPVGNSTDAEEVTDFLVSNLHRLAAQRYGPKPPASVLIQIEQAQARFEVFAPKQAARAAEGWQIRITEKGTDFDDSVCIGPQGELRLIGRIDRIDFHPETGQWAIWDYKTSDTAKKPLSVHWTARSGWQDLQLPLYRPIARKLGVTGNPLLGYIALPKAAVDCGFHLADFTEAQLAEADAVAAEIAARVAQGEFWPESIGPVQFDDFERICQTQVQRVEVAAPRRSLHRPEIAEQAKVSQAVVEQAQVLLQGQMVGKGSKQPAFPPMLIRASAGTGKTFQLSNRLLQILLSGQDVDHILATTFTRKAAGEIMHRVLQRLAMGCIDEGKRAELAQHLQDVDTSAAACLAALRRVTASVHRLRISTLDSFFATIARTFSLDMGLPPGWSTMEPVQEPQTQLNAISSLLDNHERKTLLDLVRMLAKGESSRQVSEQIRQTVAEGFQIFRATSAEAWDQLPLPSPPSEAAVESALLAFANAKIGHRSADQNLQKLHLLASIGDWEKVVEHGAYNKLHEIPATYYGKELPREIVVALEILAERAVAELLPIRRSQTLASYQVLEAYNTEYTSLIRRNRTLAFSDVSYNLSQWMNHSANSMRNAVGMAQLEFRLDCGIHHLLLDEFQDTSPEQWNILRPLAEPLGGKPRREQSFFCVGDTKQAIYGWRGGVAEIFDAVQSSVAGLKQHEMRDSFRSSPEVMEVVNEVFQNLPRHTNYSDCDAIANQWSQTFPEHRTSRKSLQGYVQLQNGPLIDKELTKEEARSLYLAFTADQIAELTRQTRASVGVLFRTNADVARMIGMLRDRGVSASQDGGNPLTDSVAVELILSLVHLADHPGDSKCAFHVLRSPLIDALPTDCRKDPQLLSEWFRKQVSRIGLGRTVESVGGLLANHLSWWDQQRLEQLIRSAHAFEASGGRLREFEESVERDRVALPSEAQVKVMTFHKSKGLEFDAVFLPELNIDLSTSNSLFVLRGEDPCAPPNGVLRYMNASLQAMLPTTWRDAFEKHKARGVFESLCMLYVAMTRARCALYMTSKIASAKPSQTFESLLQSTLASKADDLRRPEAVLYEIGEPKWYQHLESGDRPQVSLSEQLSEATEMRIRLRTDPDSAPPRGLRVTAPSSLEYAKEPQPIAGAFSYSQSVGATYGTLMHAFFAQIKWYEDYQVDRAELKRISLATAQPEELRHISLEQLFDDFERLYQLTSVRTALSQQRYRNASSINHPDRVEIDNERAISLYSDGRLIAGTIDRLAVIYKNGHPYAAEIFDFKTDTFDPKMNLLWLDERIAHHRPQLEVYAQVVSQLFQISRDRVATYLLMLNTDDLVEVAPLEPR